MTDEPMPSLLKRLAHDIATGIVSKRDLSEIGYNLLSYAGDFAENRYHVSVSAIEVGRRPRFIEITWEMDRDEVYVLNLRADL